jgi:hypothetical protein
MPLEDCLIAERLQIDTNDKGTYHSLLHLLTSLRISNQRTQFASVITAVGISIFSDRIKETRGKKSSQRRIYSRIINAASEEI